MDEQGNPEDPVSHDPLREGRSPEYSEKNTKVPSTPSRCALRTPPPSLSVATSALAPTRVPTVR